MEPTPQEMAAQLRQPNGDFGLKIGEMMNRSNEHTNRLVYDQLALQKDDQLLEIGFGNGYFINHLIDIYPGIFYYGIDYSRDMVRDAAYRNKRLINAGIVDIEEASIEKIPYPDDYFDAACTINTLYFWPSPLENAKEVIRVLQPGGKILLGIRPKHTVKDFPFIEYGFELYEQEDAEQLLKDAGFKNVQSIHQEDPPVIWNDEEIILESLCVMGTK